MKKILCVVAMGVLAACGSSSSSSSSKFKDPNKVQFTYGTPADAAGTDYDAVAGMGYSITGDVLNDPPATAQDQMLLGFTTAAFPLLVNNNLWDGIALDMFTSSPVLQDQRFGILRGAAARALAVDPADPALKVNVSCSVSFDDTGLNISNCKGNYSYSEGTSSDKDSASIGGKFAIGADALTWSFKLGADLESIDAEITNKASLDAELKGELAIDTTAGTIQGYARASYGVDSSLADTATPANDGTYAAALSDQGTWDLTFDPAADPKCITGGSLTFVRVWTTLPTVTGAFTLDPLAVYEDQAVQITYDAPVAPDLCTDGAMYALGTVP